MSSYSLTMLRLITAISSAATGPQSGRPCYVTKIAGVLLTLVNLLKIRHQFFKGVTSCHGLTYNILYLLKSSCKHKSIATGAKRNIHSHIGFGLPYQSCLCVLGRVENKAVEPVPYSFHRFLKEGGGGREGGREGGRGREVEKEGGRE